MSAANDIKLEEMTEEEQWNIINDTGVLKGIKTPQEEDPHLLVAFLLSIPLIACYLLFDYIAHIQFGYESEFTWTRIQIILPPAFISIYGFALATNYFKSNRLAQFTYGCASIAVGCLVIHNSIDDGTFGAMLKTPGLATIGILLVIQQDLLYAVCALFVCILFHNREFLLSFYPSGSMPKLHTDL